MKTLNSGRAKHISSITRKNEISYCFSPNGMEQKTSFKFRLRKESKRENLLVHTIVCRHIDLRIGIIQWEPLPRKRRSSIKKLTIIVNSVCLCGEHSQPKHAEMNLLMKICCFSLLLLLWLLNRQHFQNDGIIRKIKLQPIFFWHLSHSFSLFLRVCCPDSIHISTERKTMQTSFTGFFCWLFTIISIHMHRPFCLHVLCVKTWWYREMFYN